MVVLGGRIECLLENRSRLFAATEPKRLDAAQRISVHATAPGIACGMPNSPEETMPMTGQLNIHGREKESTRKMKNEVLDTDRQALSEVLHRRD